MEIRAEIIARVDAFQAICGLSYRDIALKSGNHHNWLNRLRRGDGVALASIEKLEAFITDWCIEHGHDPESFDRLAGGSPSTPAPAHNSAPVIRLTTEHLNELVADAIRPFVGRGGKPFTVQALADQTGIDETTITAWMREDRGPSLLNLLIVASLLGPAFINPIMEPFGLSAQWTGNHGDMPAAQALAEITGFAAGLSDRLAGSGHLNHVDRARTLAEARKTLVTLQSLIAALDQPHSITAGQLRSLIERIERLEEEKANLAADIREVYAEAKSHGYDPKIMRECIKLRKMEPDDLAERVALIDTYANALGLSGTPLGDFAAGLRDGSISITTKNDASADGQRPLIDVIAPHRDDFDHQAAQLIVQFEGMPKMAVAMGPRQTAEIIAGLSRGRGTTMTPPLSPILTLPMPPSANHLFITQSHGRGKTRRSKSMKYRGWISEAGWAIRAQGSPQFYGSRFKVTYAFERPTDKIKRDVENRIKAVSDLLVSHAVIEDDSLIESITAEWRDGIEGVQVFIEVLDGPAATDLLTTGTRAWHSDRFHYDGDGRVIAGRTGRRRGRKPVRAIVITQKGQRIIGAMAGAVVALFDSSIDALKGCPDRHGMEMRGVLVLAAARSGVTIDDLAHFLQRRRSTVARSLRAAEDRWNRNPVLTSRGAARTCPRFQDKVKAVMAQGLVVGE
ncbi:unnamed protein product [Symbiodinium microadriaticum]|nr:unnamed protein product [Symbiodinium microadriaticum]